MSSPVTYPVIAIVVVIAIILFLFFALIVVWKNKRKYNELENKSRLENKHNQQRKQQNKNLAQEQKDHQGLNKSSKEIAPNDLQSKQIVSQGVTRKTNQSLERQLGVSQGLITTGLSCDEAMLAKQAKVDQGFLVWVDVDHNQEVLEHKGASLLAEKTKLLSHKQTYKDFVNTVIAKLPRMDMNNLRTVRAKFGSAQKQKKIREQLPKHFYLHHYSPVVGKASTAITVEFYKVVCEQQNVHSSMMTYKLEHCVVHYDHSKTDKPFDFSQYKNQSGTLSEYAQICEKLKQPGSSKSSARKKLHREVRTLSSKKLLQVKKVPVLSSSLPVKNLLSAFQKSKDNSNKAKYNPPVAAQINL